jgi:exopolysaccharide biosynthesis predicted pyruvyltransferase EpsI
MTSDPLVGRLRDRIEETLRPLLAGYGSAALLDFPRHSNVGDSAIWLGEEAYLRAAGLRIRYRCDLTTYSRRRLAASIGSGLILLHGGGNLGDLWPSHQRLRERVIQDFPQNRIIQLPQSIHFAEAGNRVQARAIFNAHPDLTLLVRDHRSLDIARNEFRAPALLCPDMALARDLARPSTPPVVPIIWLARTDHEIKYHEPPAVEPDVERRDWLDEAPSGLAWFNAMLTRTVVDYPRWTGPLASLAASTYRHVATQRLERGARLLSRGRVLITDRLHGHILALLMGIPNILLDNSYGKLRSFYETWTRDSAITQWADSPAEALAKARAIANTKRPDHSGGRTSMQNH